MFLNMHLSYKLILAFRSLAHRIGSLAMNYSQNPRGLGFRRPGRPVKITKPGFWVYCWGMEQAVPGGN